MFIFGGNTGMTYDEMMRQRDLAARLAANTSQGGYTALGSGLAAAMLNGRARRAEEEGLAKAQERAQGVLASMFSDRLAGAPAPEPISSAPIRDPLDPTSISGDTMAALGLDGSTSGYRASLLGTESGGNWKAQNNEIGAGGMRGHYGRMQFSNARLQDAMDAGVIPQGTTPDQFMNSPAMQIAVENWHFADLEKNLGDLQGTQVNGQPVDMGSLVAMGHLGGANGARRYVESGGAYNPSDSFGTSLADYSAAHGGNTVSMSAMNGGQGGGMQDLVAAMSDPYLDENTRSVLSAMLQQRLQSSDPMYRMQMEKAQLELDQMRNPQPQPMAMTDDMKEYNFAVSQGYNGSFQEFMAEMKKAGATNVTTTIGGEPNDSALRGALDKKEGEAWSIYLDSATNSAGTMQDMQMLDELIGMAPQGPVTGRLANMFTGVNSAADAFNSVVKRVAPTLRAPGSGATSDIEYEGMLKSLPQLSASPEANMAISAMVKAKAAINIERGNIIAQYQNGEISAAEARRKIGEINQRSIMTPELEAILRRLDPGGASFGASSVGAVETQTVDPLGLR